MMRTSWQGNHLSYYLLSCFSLFDVAKVNIKIELANIL